MNDEHGFGTHQCQGMDAVAFKESTKQALEASKKLAAVNIKHYNASGISLSGITQPGRHDVICGRGGESNHHEGNRRFRRVVEEYKQGYQTLASKERSEKMRIAWDIVRRIRYSENPLGRFLKIGPDGKWMDVGDEEAKRKTSQALRENRECNKGIGNLTSKGPPKEKGGAITAKQDLSSQEVETAYKSESFGQTQKNATFLSLQQNDGKVFGQDGKALSDAGVHSGRARGNSLMDSTEEPLPYADGNIDSSCVFTCFEHEDYLNPCLLPTKICDAVALSKRKRSPDDFKDPIMQNDSGKSTISFVPPLESQMFSNAMSFNCFETDLEPNQITDGEPARDFSNETVLAVQYFFNETDDNEGIYEKESNQNKEAKVCNFFRRVHRKSARRKLRTISFDF